MRYRALALLPILVALTLAGCAQTPEQAVQGCAESFLDTWKSVEKTIPEDELEAERAGFVEHCEELLEEDREAFLQRY
jgi:hypothetical protein